MKQAWCEDDRSDTVVSLNFGTITERRGSLSTVIIVVINAMGRMRAKGKEEGCRKAACPDERQLGWRLTHCIEEHSSRRTDTYRGVQAIQRSLSGGKSWKELAPCRLLRECSLVGVAQLVVGMRVVVMFSGADEPFFRVAAIELETDVRVLHLTQENAAESGGALGYVPGIGPGLGLRYLGHWWGGGGG